MGDTSRNLEIAESEAPRDRPLRVTSEPIPQGAFVLRTDRVYDPQRLRVVLATGGQPDSAVLWRLDVKSDLTSAAEELVRRTSYQPVGRHWAWPLARGLATRLQQKLVHPNHVTLLAGCSCLLAAALVAFAGSSWLVHSTTAMLLAFGLVLDTADGHLARLQRTASAFGKWLDSVLDEVCDVVLHGAIAWSSYVYSNNPLWLVAGMVYLGGKYLFFTAMRELPKPADAERSTETSNLGVKKAARRVIQLLAHADVRWHAWILLAAFGRLDWELVFFAAYYPARSLALGRHWVKCNG
jgi:phosphatidylglycerophosphate synthase